MFSLLISLLIISVIIMAILAIFKNSLYSRLSNRIAALIFASGPIALIIILVLNALIRGTRVPPWIRLVEVLIIVLGGPLVLGLLAARFVQRPLHQFNNAMSSLEHSDYKVQLKPSGIREFDEIFTKFNSLINRLQQEEKLRKDLISDTSHELNTPLTTIIGQLTAMQEGKHAATDERITMLKEEAERLAELVAQLDTYTKARAPTTGKLEDVYIRRLCEQLISQFSLDLKQKGLQTKLHVSSDLTIHASSSALQQLLSNLMQNALRHSEATEITISATSSQLIFSDNGKGVPSENLPYLFERFYRVDKSRNRNTGGLGLGLAIVHELAEGQGWHVHAEATHPGLAFILTFSGDGLATN